LANSERSVEKSVNGWSEGIKIGKEFDIPVTL
jgi:hypothetical protein